MFFRILQSFQPRSFFASPPRRSTGQKPELIVRTAFSAPDCTDSKRKYHVSICRQIPSARGGYEGSVPWGNRPRGSPRDAYAHAHAASVRQVGGARLAAVELGDQSHDVQAQAEMRLAVGAGTRDRKSVVEGKRGEER